MLNLTKQVEKVLSNVLLNFGMLEVLEVTYQTYIMIHYTIYFYIVAECDKEMVYKYNTVRNFKKQNVH